MTGTAASRATAAGGLRKLRTSDPVFFTALGLLTLLILASVAGRLIPGLNDGATACILAAEDSAKELGLPVGMRLVEFAFVGVEPEVMGYGPVPAAEKALAKAGLSIDDIGLFELNEAFAVQVLSFLEHFGIDDDSDKVNRYGGAIATGHPLASSGVRLMNQLSRQFAEDPSVRYGMTAMCIGIGMGGAVIWENPHHADYGKENRA